MKKVITLGGATEDIFIHFGNETIEARHLHEDEHHSFLQFEEGTKIEVQNLHYATGGGATNSAAGLKALGYDVSTICKIGTDHAGDRVLKALKELKISTTHIVQAQNAQTGTSFIIPSPSGDRIIFAYRGANGTLQKNDLPFDAIGANDGVYITSLSGESSHLLPRIAQHAHTNGTLVANNPGKSQLLGDTKALEQALKYIDIFILNAHESRVFLSTLTHDPECAQRLLTCKFEHIHDECPTLLKDLITVKETCLNLRHYFQEILQRGPKIVVVTNGAQGVYAATKDKLYFHKAVPTDVANTVGAGDSFGSCFFGSILQGYDIETALTFGALNSSSVLSTPDAKTGLLSFEELEQKKAALSGDFLQILQW